MGLTTSSSRRGLPPRGIDSAAIVGEAVEDDSSACSVAAAPGNPSRLPTREVVVIWNAETSRELVVPSARVNVGRLHRLDALQSEGRIRLPFKLSPFAQSVW